MTVNERLIVRNDAGKFLVVEVGDGLYTVAISERRAWIGSNISCEKSLTMLHELMTHRYARTYRTLTEVIESHDDGSSPLRRAPEYDHPRPASRRKKREERRRYMLGIGSADPP